MPSYAILFAKADGGGERKHTPAPLKMRIGDHLREGQHTTRLQRVEYFPEPGLVVGDFSEYGHENCPVEQTEVQFICDERRQPTKMTTNRAAAPGKPSPICGISGPFFSR